MTRFLFYIIFLSFFLSSCYSNWQDTTKVHEVMQVEEFLPEFAVNWQPEIEYSLGYFLQQDPLYLANAAERRKAHGGDLKKIFHAYGVPGELVNIAVIESKLKPNAKSSYGAAGLWQFMKETARGYGLKVGVFRDERKDPLLSTEAAARYLNDLYGMFYDWNWVLAAYNAGPYKIKRIIKEKNVRNFWDAVRKGLIPGQTKAFVSRVTAAILIERHGVEIKRYSRKEFALLLYNIRKNYSHV